MVRTEETQMANGHLKISSTLVAVRRKQSNGISFSYIWLENLNLILANEFSNALLRRFLNLYLFRDAWVS